MADLQSRDVRLEWHEAVAIVLELCGDVDSEPEPLALEPSNVVIDPEGQVSYVRVSPSPDNAPEVRQAGRLLREMLGDAACPAPLRLLVTQCVTSPPPSLDSLGDFSAALLYYERPNRPEIIRGVYRRWSESEGRPRAAAARPPDARRDPRLSRFDRPVLIRIGGIVLLVAALGGIAAWAATSGRQGAATEIPAVIAGLAAQARGAMDDALEAIDGAVSRIADRPRTPASDLALEAARDSDSAAVRSVPSAPAESGGRRSTAASTPGARVPPPASTGEVQAAAPVDPQPAQVPAADTAIYSSLDAGVVAPIAVYPQVATALPAWVGPEDFSVIEVIVDADGRVSSVRLVEAPPHMGAAIVTTIGLSAAKSWIFRPATKDGHPVKYRQVVKIATP